MRDNIFVYISLILTGLTVTDATKMVWMAPHKLKPDSSVLVNASTSLPALALALQKIYKQRVLPNNSVR